MDFKISSLSIDLFSHLFEQDEEALEKQGIHRMIVDSNPGYPCRVSLQDAEIGETVLLINFEHLTLPTPYRSSHAIFVRESATQAVPDKNEVPEFFRHRLLSVRAFDSSGMMIDADVIDGESLESVIGRMLKNNTAEFLQIHNAKPGCYAALVERC